MASNWPVVRRENEYTAIRAALVDQPGTGGIAIIGDAGAGKTTLARLGTRELPTPVHWLRERSQRAPSRWACSPLVGAATSGDPTAFLATAREPSSPGVIQHRVDDAHLLDQLSATLLHQLTLDGSVRTGRLAAPGGWDRQIR